jgi:hypothetical protein
MSMGAFFRGEICTIATQKKKKKKIPVRRVQRMFLPKKKRPKLQHFEDKKF